MITTATAVVTMALTTTISASIRTNDVRMICTLLRDVFYPWCCGGVDVYLHTMIATTTTILTTTTTTTSTVVHVICSPRHMLRCREPFDPGTDR